MQCLLSDRLKNVIFPMTVGRSMVLVLGGLILMWYLPIISGVKNLGSWFGCGIGTALILIGLFWRMLWEEIKSLWNRQIGRVVLSVLSVGLFLFVLWALSLVWMMIRCAAFSPPPEDATVIVLGCKVNGTLPSKALTQRLEAALGYLEAHPDAKCVLSGGQGKDEDISEAQAMADYLTAHGIDPSRLYLEQASTNTGENLKYTAEVIKREGLSSSVVIVTHSYHQCRAALEAEDYGLIPSAINARSSILSYPTFFLRDLLGVAAKVVFG